MMLLLRDEAPLLAPFVLKLVPVRRRLAAAGVSGERDQIDQDSSHRACEASKRAENGLHSPLEPPRGPDADREFIAPY